MNDTVLGLLTIPVVDKVTTQRVHGRVKYYTVRVSTEDAETGQYMDRLWPFGEISGAEEGNVFVADYIVKPEELKSFHKKLLKVPFKEPPKHVAMVIQLKNSISPAIKEKLKRSVRQSDRILFGEGRLAVIVDKNDQKSIQIVKKRIEELLQLDGHREINVSVKNPSDLYQTTG